MTNDKRPTMPDQPNANSGAGEAAPESINMEQRDAPQASDVQEDANALRNAKMTGSSESERGGKSNPAAIIPDDAQDTVDHMKQMETSGQIDNSAYRGEPMMDNVEDKLGMTDRPDHVHRDLDGQK